VRFARGVFADYADAVAERRSSAASPPFIVTQEHVIVGDPFKAGALDVLHWRTSPPSSPVRTTARAGQRP